MAGENISPLSAVEHRAERDGDLDRVVDRGAPVQFGRAVRETAREGDILDQPATGCARLELPLWLSQFGEQTFPRFGAPSLVDRGDPPPASRPGQRFTIVETDNDCLISAVLWCGSRTEADARCGSARSAGRTTIRTPSGEIGSHSHPGHQFLAVVRMGAVNWYVGQRDPDHPLGATDRHDPVRSPARLAQASSRTSAQQEQPLEPPTELLAVG